MELEKYATLFLLEEQNEILEESIRNNSVSNYLAKVISKANKKVEKFSGSGRSATAKAIKNSIPTLEAARKDFLKLENEYSSADPAGKKALKEKYNALKKEHSEKLKRMKSGNNALVAAIATAALAVMSGSSISNYKPDVGMDYVRAQSSEASEHQRAKDELKNKYGDNEEVIDRNVIGTYMYKKNTNNGSKEDLDKDVYKNVISKKRSLVDAQARYKLEQSKENFKNLTRSIRDYYNFRYISDSMTKKFLEMKKRGIKDDYFIKLSLGSMIPSYARSSVVTENFFPY